MNKITFSKKLTDKQLIGFGLEIKDNTDENFAATFSNDFLESSNYSIGDPHYYRILKEIRFDDGRPSLLEIIAKIIRVGEYYGCEQTKQKLINNLLR